MTEGHGSGAHGEPSGNPGGSSGPGNGPPAPQEQGGPGYPPPGSYPPAGGYPPLPSYPQAGGYQPGPGYPPPGGYPSYPGYGPAPSAPQGYGSPPHLERPTTVRAGTVAFIAYIVLGLISSAIQFANIDDIVRRAVASAGGANGVTLDAATERSLVLVGGVIGLLFVALECLFIWFAWKGRNWARIVLFVIGGLGIVSGLTSLGSGSYLPGFLQGLAICEFVLVLAGVVLFAQRSSNEWFRYRKWQRATGQG